MSFLEPGQIDKAVIYRDVANADGNTNPEVFVIERKPVTAKTKLMIYLVKGGGYAIQLVRK
nr:glycoside hydrolase family 97 C-terminal domain-containing protein [Spirosoma sp. 209]